MKTIDLFESNPMNGLCKDLGGIKKVHPISYYVTLVEIEFSTKDEDISIQLNDGNNVNLHFFYNSADTVILKSELTTSEKKLSQFQSAIINHNRGHQTFLKLAANGQYRMCIIQLTKYDAEKNTNNLFIQFEKVFESMSKNHFFLHTGVPDLQIGEYVKKLMEMPKVLLSERLMAAGYINILLGLKLKLYLKYVKNPPPSSILSKSEIKRIGIISSSIKNSPELDYNIDDLCRECGLSAAKLQLGFKEMHGKTVCNFISDVRLVKAEELLKNSDLNVSQIVYSLGWTSRSYFCKIFKEKYQCSPKHYQTLLVKGI